MTSNDHASGDDAPNRNPAHSIRRATIHDALSIARVYIETWQDTYAGVLPTDHLAEMSLRNQVNAWTYRIRNTNAYLSKTDAVFVATTPDRQVVGFGDCGLNRLPQYPYHAEIFTLYILPDHQQQGIGQGLLHALFDHLVSARIESVLIWSLIDNPNRHFYSAMKGAIVAERSSTYWGRKVTELAYAWTGLGHAPATDM